MLTFSEVPFYCQKHKLRMLGEASTSAKSMTIQKKGAFDTPAPKIQRIEITIVVMEWANAFIFKGWAPFYSIPWTFSPGPSVDEEAAAAHIRLSSHRATKHPLHHLHCTSAAQTGDSYCSFCICMRTRRPGQESAVQRSTWAPGNQVRSHPASARSRMLLRCAAFMQPHKSAALAGVLPRATAALPPCT